MLGLTKAGIAEAKAKGVQPAGGGGFAYLRGPDDALIEYQGNQPRERFNHIHMWQEQPFCAQLWYQRHLNAPPGRGGRRPGPHRGELPGRARTRQDLAGPDPRRHVPDAVTHQHGVQRRLLFAYMNQADTPLASTRGQLIDHYGLRVTDLDAWIAKLRAEAVTFLEPPYTLGSYRAVLVEGPSREAIELVEIK